MSAPLDLRPALAPPRAHGAPLGVAQFRREDRDFEVEEEIGFAADGGAGHALLLVEKQGLDTLAVLRALAREAGVSPRDLGFAGLKDRHALTRQWITVPLRHRTAAGFRGFAHEAADGSRFRVVESAPHSRKLRRGALKGNRFRIVLGATLDGPSLARRIERIRAHGVPNYFGPQRFGRAQSNLARVEAWLEGGALPHEREARGFVYSAARALVFNAVLAARVREGTWNRLLPGEFVNLDRSRSFFAAATIDGELERRLEAADVHPTGPLVGRGEAPVGASGEAEARALAPYATLVARLGEAGLEAARRALRVVPRAFEVLTHEGRIELTFALPAGAYATTVLAELVDLKDCSLPEPDAD